MCKHVVRDDHAGGETASGKAGGGCLTEKGDRRWDALANCHFGDVARGFYPQNRNAAALKILQQIPIVGGDLYNLRRRTEAEARHHHCRVIGGMTKPRVGELPAAHLSGQPEVRLGTPRRSAAPAGDQLSHQGV